MSAPESEQLDAASDEFGFADSKLGSREYWDQFYVDELANYEQTGDEGEIWFGRCAEQRMLKFFAEQKMPKSTRICDLGTGNGSLLRKLRSNGFTHLCGVDYSDEAVKFAQRASEQEEQSEKGIRIEYHVADLTCDKLDSALCEQFDILLDKGTLDAISLSCERAKALKQYRKNICQMFRPVKRREDSQQFLVIVSCNFTSDELVKLLAPTPEASPGEPSLCFAGELPAAAQFQFGGRTGSTVSGALFQYKSHTDMATRTN